MGDTTRVGALARRWGAQVPEVLAQLGPVRPLTAIENAAEGCVRETWGALHGTYQAERAALPELRAMFRAIASDERRHAALSFEIAAWLDARLSESERAAVQDAYHAAIAELRNHVA